MELQNFLASLGVVTMKRYLCKMSGRNIGQFLCQFRHEILVKINENIHEIVKFSCLATLGIVTTGGYLWNVGQHFHANLCLKGK